MGAPQPCLGYRSITQACVALDAKGKSLEEIGRLVNRTPDVVASLLCNAAQRAAFSALNVKTPVRTNIAFQIAAAERGVTAAELASTVLTAVAEDGLFAAVLDDGPPAS